MITHEELIRKLKPIQDKDPQRFSRFYWAVWLMCHDLQPGDFFLITNRCKPKSVELFRDLVQLFILEQPFEPQSAQLELDEDGITVRREKPFDGRKLFNIIYRK